jgi:hypothetical protein
MDLNAAVAAKLLRIDPPRNEPKVTIRVQSRTVNHCIAGYIVPHQDGELSVYESDVRAFELEVEEPARIAKAEERLREYEDAIAAKARGEIVPDVSLPKGTPSLASCFREVNRRDMRPLISVRRTDEKRRTAT